MTDRHSRRGFLAGAAAAVLAACSSGGRRAASASGSPASSPAGSSPTAPAASSPAPSVATFLSHGPRDRNEVALTFHTNGDLTEVDHLLRLLDDRAVPITAFVVGNWLDQNPQFGPRLLNGPHELANHTYTHLTFASLGSLQQHDEITRCRDSLQRTAGTPGTYFRPSGTSNGVDQPSDAVLRAAAGSGYVTVVGYDVDPADYADPGADAVVRRTLAAVQPGSIVSLHFGHQGTIDAMPRILDGLGQRKLQPVTTSTLLRA